MSSDNRFIDPDTEESAVPVESEQESPEEPRDGSAAEPPQYGYYGLSLRELIIGGVWLVLFVTSFFPLSSYAGVSVWGQGISWLIPVGLPTIAVFLLGLRRFSPQGIRRVGSLGIDQFASVVFVFAFLYWAQSAWQLVIASSAQYASLLSWGVVVQLLCTLALVVLTVFAPIIPGLREDFRGRPSRPAHRNVNPIRPVIARPRPEKPVAPAPSAQDPEPEATAADAFFVPQAGDEQATTVLDVELSGENATDEIERFGAAARVPLTAHASGGDTGSSAVVEEEAPEQPGYARRSVSPDPEADGFASGDAVPAGAEPAAAVPGADAETSIIATEDIAFAHDDAGAETEDVEDRRAPARSLWSSPAVAASAEEAPFAEDPAVSDDTADLGAVADAAPATTAEPVHERTSTQPFWALAPTERDVLDDHGHPLFRIGPAAWALVIEDRGGAYVIRHDDGRIGYLHDISDVMKG